MHTMSRLPGKPLLVPGPAAWSLWSFLKRMPWRDDTWDGVGERRKLQEAEEEGRNRLTLTQRPSLLHLHLGVGASPWGINTPSSPVLASIIPHLRDVGRTECQEGPDTHPSAPQVVS